MDPDEALKRLYMWANSVLANEDIRSAEEIDAALQFVALDQWLQRGGFKPTTWKR